MRRFLRPVCYAVAVIVTSTLAVLLVLYRAAQAPPEFYVRTLRADPQAQLVAVSSLQESVHQLQDEVLEAGTWEVVFTEEQINAWLATELPQRYPHLLPAQCAEPRIAIQDDQVRVACRYEGQLSAVISLLLRVQLTDEPNTLEVKVEKAKVGILPAPLKQFLDQISRAAATTNVPFRWAETDGDPVARITIPSSHPDYSFREIVLEQVELRNQEVYLAGRTELRHDVSTASATADRSWENVAYQP